MELTSSQLQAVNHSYDPKTVLSIQAGPGTGKTFTLVRRIEKLLEDGLDPENIVVLSMTNRTVRSVRKSLTELIGEQTSQRVIIKTFHAFGSSLVEKYGEEYLPNQNAQMLMNDANFKDYTNFFLHEKKIKPRALERAMAEVKNGRDLSSVCRRYSMDRTSLQETINYFKENGILRYSDFISSAIDLLDKTEGKVVENVKVLIIDEFQDMQPLLTRFIAKIVQYDDKHITLAGDKNQCIYAFLGSTPHVTRNFIKSLGWEVDEIVLKESFRLTPENVEISNSLIRNTDLEAVKPSSVKPYIYSYQQPFDEYTFIGNEIARLICESGGLLKFSDFIVLTRTNNEVENVANFMSEKFGYNVNKFVSNSDWVSSNVGSFLDVLNVMRKGNGSDVSLISILLKLGVTRQNLRRAYQDFCLTPTKKFFEDYLTSPVGDRTFNTPIRKSSKNDVDDFLKLVNQERQLFTDPVSVMTSLAKITNGSKLKSYLNECKDHKVQEHEIKLYNNLEAFYKSVRLSFAQSNSLEHFLNNYYEEDPVFDDNCVNISTIHKAKGLEFPVDES
ncbi:hypothetical protein G210_0100 [Candida maltosa Xu316]|uniref:DNA 3'-5' helicase n=1 Tax=Candida maltosa (strain Xu316) TaxID=1245528 RepID=M3JAP6_CANMX|nr:hypothetical protein G210_0100 [Candida maltosa Xu316]